MNLWLSTSYKHKTWSIIKHLPDIVIDFSKLKFPSTTTRHPRSLSQWQKLKGSELRVILLFGDVIFKKYLKHTYYHHLMQLVMTMHYAKASSVDYEDIERINRLTKSFVSKFSTLYGVRHVVQVVHSIAHIGSTVADYGPLSSFTTFNFENDLGKIYLFHRKTYLYSLQ